MASKEDLFECIESMSQEERQRFAVLLAPILRELWHQRAANGVGVTDEPHPPRRVARDAVYKSSLIGISLDLNTSTM